MARATVSAIVYYPDGIFINHDYKNRLLHIFNIHLFIIIIVNHAQVPYSQKLF